MIKIAEEEIANSRNADKAGDPLAAEALQKWSELLEGLRGVQERQETEQSVHVVHRYRR
ncbi:MAG TPA: hypothetical protein VLJ11_12120 [Bryobacteraceae bacterium]|nr:hypothetical protein [Bryobacteraceae bacterium]